MTYDPYKDVASLVSTAKRMDGSPTAKTVESLIKSNSSFYKSTYKGVSDRVSDTKDYIKDGEAYRDEGAQAIRSAYAQYADGERDHTAAAGAAENGGNLDSYAAAQANRAAAAMISAGEDAVRSRAEGVQSALNDADANAVNAAEITNTALADGGSVLADTVADAAAARGNALKALLDYYGVLVKN